MPALPPDLSASERDTLDALRAQALRAVEERAAVAIAVRRRFAALTRASGRYRMGAEAALDVIAGEREWAVSRSTAERIVRRYEPWAD